MDTKFLLLDSENSNIFTHQPLGIIIIIIIIIITRADQHTKKKKINEVDVCQRLVCQKREFTVRSSSCEV